MHPYLLSSPALRPPTSVTSRASNYFHYHPLTILRPSISYSRSSGSFCFGSDRAPPLPRRPTRFPRSPRIRLSSQSLEYLQYQDTNLPTRLSDRLPRHDGAVRAPESRPAQDGAPVSPLRDRLAFLFFIAFYLPVMPV